MVLEKTPESALDCKEIQPVHPKGNQSWVFIRRTDAGDEALNYGRLMWRADSLEKTLITSWEIDGETVETVTGFIFGGSQITEDGDCIHELKDACSLEEKLWPI